VISLYYYRTGPWMEKRQEPELEEKA